MKQILSTSLGPRGFWCQETSQFKESRSSREIQMGFRNLWRWSTNPLIFMRIGLKGVLLGPNMRVAVMSGLVWTCLKPSTFFERLLPLKRRMIWLLYLDGIWLAIFLQKSSKHSKSNQFHYSIATHLMQFLQRWKRNCGKYCRKKTRYSENQRFLQLIQKLWKAVSENFISDIRTSGLHPVSSN